MKYFLLLFLCLSFLNIKAQLLWEISGNGLKKPSFLYGTMHINDERVFQFSDSVMAKFNQSESFAGELKVDQGMMFKVLSHLFMPADTTLKDLLNEEEYTFVKGELGKKLGMVSAFTDRMKPIFISMLVAESETVKGLVEGQQADSTQSVRPPLDLYFQELAQDKEMEVFGLETFAEQLNAFNTISLKDQAIGLYNELKNPETANGFDTEKLIQLYTAQNLDSIYILTQEGLDATMNEALLVKRNAIMVERAEVLMRSKSIFIGVGAAHLSGEKGLVQLLRQKGFTVEPVL